MLNGSWWIVSDDQLDGWEYTVRICDCGIQSMSCCLEKHWDSMPEGEKLLKLKVEDLEVYRVDA